jgi:methyl-accepting chemotaxis protein
LTVDLTELLGKIMAQLLSILAFSTKMITDRRISELGYSLCLSSLVDYGAEKLSKRLAGRKEIEDAVLRLDTLTKEEILMIEARNLEVTHHVDENVEATKVLTVNIDDNVKAIKVLTKDVGDDVRETKALTEEIGDNVKVTKSLTESIGDNVKATKALTEDVGNNVNVIDQNLKATKDGTQHFLSIFNTPTDLPWRPKIVTDDVRRMSPSTMALNLIADTPP